MIKANKSSLSSSEFTKYQVPGKHQHTTQQKSEFILVILTTNRLRLSCTIKDAIYYIQKYVTTKDDVIIRGIAVVQTIRNRVDAININALSEINQASRVNLKLKYP